MRIWCGVRGEGSEPEHRALPQTQEEIGMVRCEEMRDAGKLSALISLIELMNSTRSSPVKGVMNRIVICTYNQKWS